ncbi:HIT-like protein, partial [Dentipellis sp. KUC8613]
MSNGALTVLRQYAQKRNPSTLPPSLYFSHTDATLTIFDTFPKALFHFLVLPRPAHYQPRGLSVFDLASLRALLRKTENRERGREVLLDLRAEGARLRGVIEEEMRKRYGFVWGVWMGFHAVPSMEHLHLHVISADLCSERLKHKKHYNSFHPARGFFLPLDDVLAWYDAAPSYFDTVSQLKKSEYEPRLKEDLVCFRCERALKNMPALKAHLQEEWD